MGRKRKTYITIIISSPESRIEVCQPDLRFENEAKELQQKMLGTYNIKE